MAVAMMLPEVVGPRAEPGDTSTSRRQTARTSDYNADGSTGASLEMFLRKLVKLGVALWLAPATQPEERNYGHREFSRPLGWQEAQPEELERAVEGFRAPDKYSPHTAAVCANMGGAVVVVDVDTKNDGDIEKVRKLLGELKVRIFAELGTPSGGRHFYIAGREDIPTVHSSKDNERLPGFPGVDIQSYGTNVFVPGTRRPKYGGAGYTIVFDHLDDLINEGDPEGADRFAGWVADQLASHVVGVCGGKERAEFVFDPAPQWDGTPLDERQQKYLDSALAGEAKKVAEAVQSGRNDALNIAALKLGHYIAGAGLGQDRVVDALTGAARQSGLVDDDGVESVNATIRSGLRAGVKTPRAVPQDRADEGSAHVHLRDRLMRLSDLKTMKPVEPLIEGFLWRDTLAQLAGGPGTYKTFGAIAMGCSLAAGKKFCGFAVPRPETVVYVAAEGANGMEARIMAWAELWKVDPDKLEERLIVLPLPIQLGDKVDVSEAIDVVRETKAGLLVLDTRARCTLGLEENSATEQGTAIEAADTIRRAAGCTTLALHHTPRTGNAGRGTNAWDGAVWSDLRMKGSSLAASIHCEKHKDAPSGCDHNFSVVHHTVSQELMPGATLLQRQTLVLSGLRSGQTEITAGSCRVVLDIIRTKAPPDGFTGTIMVALGAEKDLAKSTVYEALKWLADKGYIKNCGTQKRPKWILGDKDPDLLAGETSN